MTKTDSQTVPKVAQPHVAKAHLPVAKRYLLSVLIGFGLVFVFDVGLHIYKGPDKPANPEGTNSHQDNQARAAERAQKIEQFNKQLTYTLDTARPWDVVSNFYTRIQSSRYSIKVLSWSAPFRVTNASNQRISERDLWNFPGRRQFEFIIGIPDGLIFTVKQVMSGGWLNICLNLFATLVTFSILCHGVEQWKWNLNPYWTVILFPFYTSISAAMIWSAMWYANSALTFLLAPAASVVVFLLPCVKPALGHLPLLVTHKAVEESVESLIHGEPPTPAAATVEQVAGNPEGPATSRH